MVQLLVRIHRISHPLDVTDIVFVTLKDLQIYIHTSRIIGTRNDTIGDDVGIPITQFVVLLNHGFLVVLILFFHELLGAEEVDDIVIIGLLHHLVYLVVAQGFVTIDIDMRHLGLDIFIHRNQHFDIARVV